MILRRKLFSEEKKKKKRTGAAILGIGTVSTIAAAAGSDVLLNKYHEKDLKDALRDYGRKINSDKRKELLENHKQYEKTIDSIVKAEEEAKSGVGILFRKPINNEFDRLRAQAKEEAANNAKKIRTESNIKFSEARKHLTEVTKKARKADATIPRSLMKAGLATTAAVYGIHKIHRLGKKLKERRETKKNDNQKK